MWAPDGLVTGQAALHHWGASRIPAAIDVVVPSAVTRTPPSGVRLWRSDRATRIFADDGIRLVEPGVATIHAGARADPSRRTGVILDAVREGAVTATAGELAAAAHPRLRGRAALLEVLALARRGVSSVLEHRARTEVFTGPAWRELEWQVPLSLGGRRVVADVLHRQSRVVVELDGARYHSDDRARRRDIERDALLAGEGYLTIRFTWEDIDSRPHWCRQRVAAAIGASRRSH